MAQGATVYHLIVELSDVDRGVYRSLDLRVACHPSESMRHLVTRLLAFCLCHEEDLAFGKGLSTTDEPAAWVRDPDGRVRLWIDVGHPSPERLHRARKAALRVVVFAHQDLDDVEAAARDGRIHRAPSIEIFRVTPDLLDALGSALERTTTWQLVRTGGEVFVTVGDTTINGNIERMTLPQG